MSFYVYILYSEKSDIFYKGLTKNLERRLKEHNSGQTKSTKAHTPWKLIRSEEYGELKEAREREKFLKSGDGRKYVRSLL